MELEGNGMQGIVGSMNVGVGDCDGTGREWNEGNRTTCLAGGRYMGKTECLYRRKSCGASAMA